jgi:hypothetical protein
MIVCINCKVDTKAKMDSLLGGDHYRDYSELVAVAVDNLWMLVQEIAEKGALVIGEVPAPPVAPAVSRPAAKAEQLSPGKAKPAPARQGKPAKAASAPAPSGPVRIPELFSVDGLESLSATVSEITTAEEPDEVFTLDRWLFGQYNKLLPVKANCRALLRIVADYPDGVPLIDIAPRIGEAAALLGDYLADCDRRHQVGRDDLLATAFPRSGTDAEKSRARYATQFVGSTNSQGVLSGLLRDYRMAALAAGAGARLMPTEPAIRFARLTNPVLDASQTEPALKFTPEEVAFLLDHIRAHVPAEAFAFRTLIEAIANGAVTPDRLDEALRVHVPAETNRSLSPSFLTSQRSGALSRMADLGLIARERKGVRVSYTITPEGEAFVREGNTDKSKEGVRS